MSSDLPEAHGLDLNSSSSAADPSEAHGLDLNLSSSAAETLAENLADLGTGKEPEEGGSAGAVKEEAEREAISAPKQATPRGRGRPKKLAQAKQEAALLPACCSPFQDERKVGFAVSDLVWGKVRNHPWWPGQVFDPADASEMALNHRKKKHVLVAYFRDKTFAWHDESMLKPYQAHFAHMEGQSRMDAFVAAINDSLAEVARRVELALSCSCFVDDALKEQKLENAGIREETNCPLIDASFILNSFQPQRFLGFVEELARAPRAGVDRLELVIAKAQLRAFNRSRGYPDLPEFSMARGLEEEAEISPVEDAKTRKDGTELSIGKTPDTASGKQKRRGRPSSSSNWKHKSENGRKKKRLYELIEDDGDDDVLLIAVGSGSKARAKHPQRLSGEKHKVVDSDSPTSMKNKKQRLDLLGDIETRIESKTCKGFSKFRECMRRAAGKLSQSPPILKSNGPSSQESPAPPKEKRGGDVDDRHASPETQKAEGVFENHSSPSHSSPSEMLSQLCLASTDPMKEYSFLSTIVSFFAGYRNSLASSSSGDKALLEAIGFKKGTSKSAPNSASDDTSSPDNSEKVEEHMPTALILNFNDPGAIPSETDLIRIFIQYGPLKEADTEIMKKANRAKVVFKRRDDAEKAFSSAGKFGIFGPALTSYRLSYLSPAQKRSHQSTSHSEKDASSVGAAHSEAQEELQKTMNVEMLGNENAGR